MALSAVLTVAIFVTILGASHAHEALSAFVSGLPGVPATTTRSGLGRKACDGPNRRDGARQQSGPHVTHLFRATYSAYSNGRLPSSCCSSLASPSLSLTAWATAGSRPCLRRLRRRSEEGSVRLRRGSVFGLSLGSGSEFGIRLESFGETRSRYRRRRCRVAVSLAAAKEATLQVGDDRDGGTRADDGADGRIEGLQLFNTQGRRKQPFVPQDRRRVKFYSCGPTVYDFAHIGNFRAFLTYDILKRWLLYQGYEVDHVCNLTDVDDKIIQRMARDGVTLKDLTSKYASLFFDDLAALNILPASRYPRATEHINDIVEMIQGLVGKGFAYEKNGSVYFRVSAYPKYGALACLDVSGMEDGAGEGGGITDAADFVSEKESSKDFALWKAYKVEDGDVYWETQLGKGRPGWHIECSAMARRFLGETVDVHAGGIDLVFPHHENEIAQSEGFTGKPFCRCWVHNAFVNVDGEKMSKSKGNFLTLRGTLDSAMDVRGFRYLVVASQYRTSLAFSKKSLDGARKTVQRLDKLRAGLQAAAGETLGASANAAAPFGAVGVPDGVSPTVKDAVAKGLGDFEAGMNDDLNTPRAAAALFYIVKAGEGMLKQGNHGGHGHTGVSQVDASFLLSALDRIDFIFGIYYEPRGFDQLDNGAEAQDLPEGLTELLERRLVARESKDWATADAVRDEIIALGYAVKDVKGKPPIVTRL